MTNSSLKFRPVSTAQLFYGQWKYCVKFFLTEVTVLRNTLDPAEINLALTERMEWRRNLHQRFPGLATTGRNPTISQSVRDNICELAQLLRSQLDYRMVISVDFAWVYTNNLDLVRKITQLDFLNHVKLTQAVVDRPNNVVVRKNSPHKWRSYFRSTKLTQEEKSQLHSFIATQQVRISPAMQQWLSSHFLRTQDYYFVDYDSESWLTMLSLVRPGLIRKTMPIQTK